MAQNTKIEWATHTFNPVIGCQKVGPGCDNCYAEAQDKFRKWTPEGWGPNKPRKRTSAAYWKQPLKWNAAAEIAIAEGGLRPRIFGGSLCDPFDKAWDAGIRRDYFNLIRATPYLDWLLVTKRPGNIAKMLPDDWGDGYPNVWLGCTIVSQEEADRDIAKLLAVPAAVRFLSMEPLLGPVDLSDRCNGHYFENYLTGNRWHDGPIASIDRSRPGLDWIIVGGESGLNARPMEYAWAASIRDQCEAADVAMFFKQWGEYLPVVTDQGDDGIECYENGSGQMPVFESDGVFPLLARDGEEFWRVGKARAGRLLDGRTHDDMPGVM